MNVELSAEQKKELEVVERFHSELKRIDAQVRKVIVGQSEVVDQVMMTLLAGGNSMITGVPGLAKTLLIATVAQVLHLNFKRIQFTPDLMPGDITGSEIIEEDRATGKRERIFVKGPIFANIILADEINRTPPKTQSALLEAMQERSVTVEGKTYILEKPFFVLATQNPIELEGTYPLPEAQLDRFMFNIKVGYPTAPEEERILMTTTRNEKVEVKKVLSARAIINLQKLVNSVAVSEMSALNALEAATAVVSCSPPSITPSLLTSSNSVTVAPVSAPPLIVSPDVWLVMLSVLTPESSAAARSRDVGAAADVSTVMSSTDDTALTLPATSVWNART